MYTRETCQVPSTPPLAWRLKYFVSVFEAYPKRALPPLSGLRGDLRIWSEPTSAEHVFSAEPTVPPCNPPVVCEACWKVHKEFFATKPRSIDYIQRYGQKNSNKNSVLVCMSLVYEFRPGGCIRTTCLCW